MNQNSEKKPFSTDMPANSIPDTNFQPDYNWTASQSAPLVTVSQEEWNEWMRKNMEYRASPSSGTDIRAGGFSSSGSVFQIRN